MSKAFVDELIRNMKAASVVTKVAPWMVEGIGQKQMNVRYVGLLLKGDWLEIFSDRDNLLLKFITDRSTSYVEVYLANEAPFTKIITRQFENGDKWEVVLGEVKRRLRKDKSDFLNHTDQAGNIYDRIKKLLR